MLFISWKFMRCVPVLSGIVNNLFRVMDCWKRIKCQCVKSSTLLLVPTSCPSITIVLVPLLSTAHSKMWPEIRTTGSIRRLATPGQSEKSQVSCYAFDMLRLMLIHSAAGNARDSGSNNGGDVLPCLSGNPTGTVGGSGGNSSLTTQ